MWWPTSGRSDLGIFDVAGKLVTLDLREFARQYTAAWCSKDPERVANFFSPKGSLSVNSGPPAVGRTDITELARGFMTTFPDLQVFMDDLVIEGDRAVYHWTLTGSNTGPGGTGHQVRISGFEAWEIGADGLIAKSQGNFDTTAYRWQLEHGLESPR